MSQFVRKPPPYSMPSDCLLYPGRLVDDTGWIDPNREYDGVRGPLHPLISAEGFRQTAFKHAELRLADAEDLAQAVTLGEEFVEEIEELKKENEQLRDELASIAGLRRAGFTIQKVKGPRPKETA